MLFTLGFRHPFKSRQVLGTLNEANALVATLKGSSDLVMESQLSNPTSAPARLDEALRRAGQQMDGMMSDRERYMHDGTQWTTTRTHEGALAALLQEGLVSEKGVDLNRAEQVIRQAKLEVDWR